MVDRKIQKIKPIDTLVGSGESKQVVDLIKRGYTIGDFMIVETFKDMHVGFYAGICEAFKPRLVLSSVWRYFKEPKAGEVFDNLHFVDCVKISNIKAYPLNRKEAF